MRIIPAIDLIEGKCVRLTQGDYAQRKIYNENPLEVAKAFEDAGLRYLHLVDLDGAKAKKVVNHAVLERIATHTRLQINFGGGVQSEQDLKTVFEAGAQQVTGGSIAVRQPELFEQWLRHYGSNKIILGADVKEGLIAISGWQELSQQPIEDFLEGYRQKGVQYVICTDISKDGLLAGTSLDLYAVLRKKFPDLSLIASGGVSNLDDLEKLQALRLEGAIIGKALYEGAIRLQDLQRFA
jgi:phosphoribosylformimino-5-aminoimidazole carboxamide ribotide isomerase